MKLHHPEHGAPADALARKGVAPVICYPVDSLPPADLPAYRAARSGWTRSADITIPPRDARCFTVAAGQFFRITRPEGPQVGDLNLWNAANLAEHTIMWQVIIHVVFLVSAFAMAMVDKIMNQTVLLSKH